ncbi:hypothetical protein SS50377_23773 [Spironucleus salmonicida]|uniref:Uncharacterized protein n=1 Tax=Spironucleus salmonicida TaxID=348837 RepID=V6LRY4_9EUKA|nr:hypothetical protein SS50377_23773 [Spironucleus salmonicida]|eukprot:EST46451.1 Hypothetical protein SS50377_13535 [Spironucleus salmonicida]
MNTLYKKVKDLQTQIKQEQEAQLMELQLGKVIQQKGPSQLENKQKKLDHFTQILESSSTELTISDYQ